MSKENKPESREPLPWAKDAAREIHSLSYHWRAHAPINQCHKCDEISEIITRHTEAASVPSSPTREEIRGAVARGWCHDANQHKVMDPDLAIAISEEVEKALARPTGVPPTNKERTK